MALAAFFDKNLLSAAQVLQGFDAAAFTDRLERHVVGLAFDAAAVRSPEGLATLDLALRLIARLYPRIAVLPLGRLTAAVKRQMTSLVNLARAINPDIEIAATGMEASVCLVVGKTSYSSGPAVYVGSDEWLARVSSETPLGSGASRNPFGAGAAACLGCANLFRLVFADQLSHGIPDHEATLSLFDYSTGVRAVNGPPLAAVDLKESFLVGVGAIGNGAVWVLSRLAAARGTLHLVDHEAVELSNLQRYVLALSADDTRAKVELAAEYLRATGIDPVPHRLAWDKFASERGDWRFERVAVAVDTERDRIAVQASLPAWIVNSWTQTGDLGVSRHRLTDAGACLACLYLPQGRTPDEDEVIATAIGIPEMERRMQLRELLVKGTPIGPDLAAEIAGRIGAPPEALLPFADQPLRAFYARAICGGAVVRTGPDTRAAAAQVPLAFQSALAGVMLAAELVVHAGELRDASLPTKTVIDLTRPLAQRLSVPVAKHPRQPSRARCICQDPDFVEAYRLKYAAADSGEGTVCSHESGRSAKGKTNDARHSEGQTRSRRSGPAQNARKRRA